MLNFNVCEGPNRDQAKSWICWHLCSCSAQDEEWVDSLQCEWSRAWVPQSWGVSSSWTCAEHVTSLSRWQLNLFRDNWKVLVRYVGTLTHLCEFTVLGLWKWTVHLHFSIHVGGKLILCNLKLRSLRVKRLFFFFLNLYMLPVSSAE